ncbi:WG repeat-containing protein [Hymenobacter psychrophilus]|uniref:WG containing repeat-containing protein n=1 Tax=Hymenobacter psychrophilus TaxID=651662 RepID=A0A1H3HTY7_9BACT|nr:WG repeat-containing protein [Hymenobacter psychrophilus]SDY18981.1 WG containing repeat-containing protein [Hymenobacter psychrophilus]
MLHQYQSAPFFSPIRQQQFEAIAAALATEAGAPPTLLLGQVPLPAGYAPLDALLLRPRSITIVQLLPAGGELELPDLRTGPWYLDGTPLELPDPETDGADNPFARFERQRAALAALLSPHLPAEAANLHFITGLVLFSAPVQFGATVEARMGAVPAASTFHLLPDPSRFTRRLAQLASPEIDLTPTDFEQLAALLVGVEGLVSGAAAPAPAATVGLAVEPGLQATEPEPAGPAEQLRRWGGQLWRWLGAEDVAELDRTSTGYEIDLDATHQERQDLEALRQQLQQQMQQQLSALEVRETAREQRMTALQEQLQAAPIAANAPDLAARLNAEQQEKEALEASAGPYQPDLDGRNQELGQRIRHLEQLITQLAPAPTGALAASGATVDTPPATGSEASAQVPGSLAPAAKTKPLADQPGAWAGYWARVQAVDWKRLLEWVRATTSGRLAALSPCTRYAGLAGGAALVLALGVGRCSPEEPVAFEQNGQYGLLLPGGDTLVPARYAGISEFREGRAVVEQEGVFGFVAADGTEVIKPAYDALYPYADGYARARAGGLYTFLDEDGAEFSAFYFAARDFSGGYAAVLTAQGWHYIQGNEEPAAPIVFQEAYSFDQELARVKTGGYFTFIGPSYLADTTAGTAPFGRYASAVDFDDQGRARVSQNGRTFFIDRQAQEVKE